MGLIAVGVVAGCAPEHPDPHCLHYGSARRAEEGVPECDFRGPHTLINGLPAAHDWNAS